MANAKNIFQLADIFLTFGKRTKYNQPVFVGQRFQKLAGEFGVFVDVFDGLTFAILPISTSRLGPPLGHLYTEN